MPYIIFNTIENIHALTLTHTHAHTLSHIHSIQRCHFLVAFLCERQISIFFLFILFWLWMTMKGTGSTYQSTDFRSIFKTSMCTITCDCDEWWWVFLCLYVCKFTLPFNRMEARDLTNTTIWLLPFNSINLIPSLSLFHPFIHRQGN